MRAPAVETKALVLLSRAAFSMNAVNSFAKPILDPSLPRFFLATWTFFSFSEFTLGLTYKNSCLRVKRVYFIKASKGFIQTNTDYRLGALNVLKSFGVSNVL